MSNQLYELNMRINTLCRVRRRTPTQEAVLNNLFDRRQLLYPTAHRVALDKAADQQLSFRRPHQSQWLDDMEQSMRYVYMSLQLPADASLTLEGILTQVDDAIRIEGLRPKVGS